MKVFVVRNKEAKLGHQLVIVADDGTETVLDMLGTDPKNENILKLPENPSNRKWLSISKIGESGVLELEYKETRVLGQRTETSEPKKGLEEYLVGEDKEVYLKLVEKALANKAAQRNEHKILNKKEALLKKLAQYEAELEALNTMED